MKRRAFIAGLGGAAAWPMVARAQQPGKIPRIGLLWSASSEKEEAHLLGPLQRGFSDLGYVDGKTIELVNRFADNHYDRFDALARELIDAKVDVIVADIVFGALAAKRANATIPVVFVLVPDPVGLHVVDSLAHPGGNMTGFSIMGTDLTAKFVELLKDCLTKLSSIVLLYNPNGSVAQRYVHDALAAAQSINIEMSLVEARAADELDHAFTVVAERRPDALMIAADAVLYNERDRIASFGISHRLPAIGMGERWSSSGTLMSYGPDYPDLFRRAAIYVDKILKGAKPADLPVEQPTKFKLIVNVRTARAIGVAIPASILLRADEVIE